MFTMKNVHLTQKLFIYDQLMVLSRTQGFNAMGSVILPNSTNFICVCKYRQLITRDRKFNYVL